MQMRSLQQLSDASKKALVLVLASHISLCMVLLLQIEECLGLLAVSDGLINMEKLIQLMINNI